MEAYVYRYLLTAPHDKVCYMERRSFATVPSGLSPLGWRYRACLARGAGQQIRAARSGSAAVRAYGMQGARTGRSLPMAGVTVVALILLSLFPSRTAFLEAG
jgi:hypothetical protein